VIRNSRRVVALAVAGAVAIAPVISGCGAGEEPQTSAPTQLTEGVNASIPKNRPAAAQIDIRNLFVLGPKPGQTLAQGGAAPLYATIINQVKGRPDKLVSVSSPTFSQVKLQGGGVVIPAAAPSGAGSAVKLIGQTIAPGAAPSASPTGKKGKKSPGATATPSATGTPVTPSPTGTGEAPGGNPTHESSNTPSAPPQTAAVPSPATGTGPLVVLTGATQQLVGGEQIMVTLQFEQAGSVQVQVPVIPQQGEYETYPAAPGTEATPSGAASPSPNVSGGSGTGGATPTPAGSATP
jgi:copper(I)-binding protein